MQALGLKWMMAMLASGMLLQMMINSKKIEGRIWLAPGMTHASLARVTLTTSVGQFVGRTETSTDGRFAFYDLPAGSFFTVTASLAGYRTAQTVVQIANNFFTETTLILHPRTRSNSIPAYSSERFSLSAQAKADYLRAVKLLQKNDFQPAISALKSVVAAAPGFAAGYELMGETYERLHKMRQARRAWRKSIQLDPAQVSAAVNLARYDNNHRHWQRAVRRLQAATATAGRAAKTKAAAKTAVNARPWQWYWELGRAEYGSQHWRRAQTALAHAEAAGATSANLHILLANLAVRGHNYPAARHEFELYLKADAHGKQAKRARAIVKDMIAHGVAEPNSMQ